MVNELLFKICWCVPHTNLLRMIGFAKICKVRFVPIFIILFESWLDLKKYIRIAVNVNYSIKFLLE